MIALPGSPSRPDPRIRIRDSTFNGSGTLVVTLSGTLTDESRAGLVLQPDGKIVSAGLVANGSAALIRLNPDGSGDTGFGGGGGRVRGDRHHCRAAAPKGAFAQWVPLPAGIKLKCRRAAWVA